MTIQYKTPEEVAKMRAAGLVVGQTLELLRSLVKPGISTGELDEIAEEKIRSMGAIPSFKGYYGFPATLCTSINEEIVHAIPSRARILEEGDLLSIDCGAIVDGWHGDAAFSVVVGAGDPEDQRLIDVCTMSMWVGIAAAKIGGRLSDISHAIEKYVRSQGRFGILEEYGGHGIGTEMHQEPHVLNFGRAHRGPELVPGLVLAIEPMITRGSSQTKVLADDWTVVSIDGSRGAHAEQTFTLMPDGRPWVLTSLDGGVSQLATLGISGYTADFPQGEPLT
jgi:methionyl aminopeptidase